MMEEGKKNDKPKVRHGGRNLILMGAGAVLIARKGGSGLRRCAGQATPARTNWPNSCPVP